ncbi:MAG: Glutathione transport system permease protein GsiC [Alphaproteobacteria bacterium MarineAlpha10_Bin1]|jgi:peptide/nickel transport system permease protein|nr:MAG: Glutathione transport system permease protein GsiC [Alphaproteobacteria bacterium MarineAlpha10_Bin1]
MQFLAYILSRLVQMVPVLFLVVLIAFLAMELVPGDPIMLMLGGRANETMLAALHAEFGLDRPVVTRFYSFIVNALQGDLGTSIIQRQPVSVIVGERIEKTVFVIVYGAILAVLVALPLAVIAAMKHDRPVDHAIRLGGMVGMSMPPFWLALLLILLFGLGLGWFPIGGYGEGFFGHLWHLFLPGLTIALFLSPILVASLRAAMLDVMGEDYIEVARSKGLSPRRIMFKHVLRNALIPAITVLSINIGWLLSGAVIVEYVFSIPGMGSLLVRSVGSRDYPVIQGLTVVFALFVMVTNLAADLSYMLVDRRVLRK